MKYAEPTPGLLEREQFRIANPEQRAAKDRNQRHGILGIGERAQQNGQCADLG